MKTQIKKIDNNLREIEIEVSGDIVKNKFDEVFKRIGEQAKVPGFRVGHVPRDILEERFSSLAREEVLKELIPQLYGEAVDKEKLEVIELPQIFDVKLEKDFLSFKAKVEVSPEVKVENYKKIKVKHQKIEVTDDEVKRALESLKESRKLENLDDDLAHSLGYPTLADLKEALRMQIFLEKQNKQRQEIEEEIIKKLEKEADFKVPSSMVKRQLEEMVRAAKVDLALKGLPKEKIEQEEPKIRKELEPEAQRQVKVYLILASIAKKEGLVLNNNEDMPRKVMEFILRNADW